MNPPPENLINAIYAENKTYVENWIKKGYSLDIKNEKWGENTILLVAASTGNVEIFNDLIKEDQSIHQRNQNLVSSLEIACSCKNLDFIKHIMDLGGDIFNISKDGDPCFFSSLHSTIEIAQLFLERGVDINTLNSKTGMNAISWNAFDSEHNDINFWLIEQGINIHHPDKSGKTALYEAYYHQNFFLMKKLLESGATFDVFDPDGKNWFEKK